MRSPAFAMAVERAVNDGLVAAAILDREGNVVAIAGELSEDEARPIAGVVTTLKAGNDLARRMFAGEIVELALDDREVGLGIAGRCVFVVVVLGGATEGLRELARVLRHDVEQVIRGMQTELAGSPPWGGGSGGSSSGPAELPLIEIGVTVSRRERGKA